VWWALVIAPSGMLYKHGPAALGFHEGAPDHDICSRITNIAASFWESSVAAQAQCDERIRARIESIAVFLTAAMYFAAMARSLWTLGTALPGLSARFFYYIMGNRGRLCYKEKYHDQNVDRR